MAAGEGQSGQGPALLGMLAEQFWRAADRRLRPIIEGEVTRITAPVIRGGKLVASTLSGLIPLASLPAHKTTHESGGSDALTGSLDATARLQIATDGTLRGTRRQLNLVAGSGISLTGSDDAANERVQVTITNTFAAGGPAPSDARYVTTAADASLTNEVVIPGLAGSADIAGVAGGGISEEWDTTTTGLTWFPSTPPAVDSNTTRPSHLYVRTDDSTEYLGLRLWAPAGAFDARLKLSVGDHVAQGNYPSAGLLISNDDRSVRLFGQLQVDRPNTRYHVSAYTYSGGPLYTRIGSAWPVYGGGQTIYLRIRRDAGGTIWWYWSDNGYAWLYYASVSFAITVARIGVAVRDNACVAFFDWLRTDV